MFMWFRPQKDEEGRASFWVLMMTGSFPMSRATTVQINGVIHSSVRAALHYHGTVGVETVCCVCVC